MCFVYFALIGNGSCVGKFGNGDIYHSFIFSERARCKVMSVMLKEGREIV